MSRTISQKRFLKGVNATFGQFSEIPGILTRISNLLFSKRGSLRTCDGSLILTSLNGMGPQALDAAGKNYAFMELFLFAPAGAQRGYFALIKDPVTHFGAPTGLAAVDGGAGGLLNAGTYHWAVTAVDGAGGETPISNEVTLTLAASHKANLSWNPVTNATGYNVYRTAVGGAFGAELLAAANVQATSYVDNIPDTGLAVTPSPGIKPPIIDTTQSTMFTALPMNSWSALNAVKSLPADVYLADIDSTGGGYGGGGGGGATPTTPGGTTGQGAGPTASGGVLGNLSSIPQLLQFVNKIILLLGNGFAPQQSDGTTGGTATLTNTFSALYPIWQSAVTYLQNDLIQVLIGGTNYLFKAIQGGTSGGGAPAFSAILNSTVVDNKIIWQNIGQVSSSPAPRGAAHGIVYAGSLWVANTSPTSSSDGLDGPSALRMSDLNNPNSWNPLNSAQIAKDEGTQIQTLITFTIAEQGIAPVGSLIIFKDFSVYQVIGVFGSTSFTIQQAKTDMGNIAPRSANFLPGFGIMRLAHLGFAVFDGVRDKLLSEEIRPYLFGGGASDPDIVGIDWNFAYMSKGAQVANPPMYVCACPVIGGNPLPVLGGITVLFTGAVVTTIPPGNYYVRVTVKGVISEISISAEFGPFAIDATHSVDVFLPAVPAGTLGFRVYLYTKGSPSYTYYYDPLSQAVPITFLPLAPGNIGTPPSNGALAGFTRLFCFDLVLKAWTIIDLPFQVSVLKQIRVPGSIPITVCGGFIDTTMRRLFAGDQDWDGVPISWTFRSPEVYSEGGSQPLFVHELIIRGVASQAVANTITITVTLNGTDDSTFGTPQITMLGTSQFECKLTINRPLIENAHATVKGTGVCQIDSCDWDIEPGTSGAPLVIA
jgi:hypothetical protein